MASGPARKWSKEKTREGIKAATGRDTRTVDMFGKEIDPE